MPAGRIQPGNADTIALLDVADIGANGSHMAHTSSWPGTSGRRGFTGQSPSAACRSVWQTPQASILTSTSWAPGRGTATSSIVSGSPNACTTAAFIVLSIDDLLSIRY